MTTVIKQLVKIKRSKPTYLCSYCRIEFEYADDWTHEDAINEAMENGFENKALFVVCDVCYKQLMSKQDD